MTTAKLKAPFPAFGGKSRVADVIWQRIGNVQNAIEPFANSAAWLLVRPHKPKVETLNDSDCYIANFWRATSIDPESVVDHCDSPVNEADLHARHRWLVLSETAIEFRRRMRTEPEYFDAKIAGWWCWGLCCWIGSGWCSVGAECEQRPHIGDAGGLGVHAKRSETGENWNQMPHLADFNSQNKINPPSGQLPQLRGDSGAAGSGVHASAGPNNNGRPQLTWHSGTDGQFINDSRRRLLDTGDWNGTCAERRAWLLDWFGRLRDRLRNVRVCCGDWERVCGSHSTTTRLGTTGIFFDPPYAKDIERMIEWRRHLRGAGPEPKLQGRATNRDAKLYASDADDVDRLVARVHNYCVEHGDDPEFRIALAGYEGEHDALEQLGWQVVAWKSGGGYANRGGENENRDRERLWFSPHCLGELPRDSAVGQRSLFGVTNG